MVGTRLFTYALHTYSRAYPEAPKPPWLGGGSGRTGQAAWVSWIADLLPSEPRARPSQPPAQPRGSSWVDGASSCLLPRHCCVLPLGSHREQLPLPLQTASCHAWSAACGQAALWTRGACGWWVHHLSRRRSDLEGHGEHRHDGAEGLQPLEPSAPRAPASTPTRSVDGRRLARLGLKSCARTRPQCSSELTAACSSMPAMPPAPESWGSSLSFKREAFPELGHRI